MPTNRLVRARFIARLLAGSLPIIATIASAAPAAAQSAELLQKLNAPAGRVADSAKSGNRVFTAYLDLTKPPQEVGREFNQTTIWPGMDGFAAVAKWAEANRNMGKVLLEVQNCQVLGVPYGTKGVDPKFVERGLIAEIGVGGDLTKVRFPYLNALETIAAYATAESYRLCEEGKFEEAFALGIANLRLLRQACDAQMFGEKFAAMGLLADAYSVHRDMLFAYGAKMTTDSLRKLALKDYPEVRVSENERMKRLELPEGDLVVAEELVRSVFADDSSVNEDTFAATFAGLQAAAEPLTSFGAVKRWKAIAGVHGSRTASLEKLNEIYDDWWRRWRLPAYGQMMSLPTAVSRINPVKYAAVSLAVKDIDGIFERRRRLIAEYDGTVIAAGLAGYHRQFGAYPDILLKSYTQFFPKRFDFDPYDKNYGGFNYQFLGTKTKSIDVEGARVEVTGCVLFAVNADHEPNGASRHAAGGATDDFVIWPPLRAVARGQGK